MNDFPTDSEDDNLSDSDDDPDYVQKVTVSDPSSESDSDDEVPLANLLITRNTKEKSKPKWTKMDFNINPSYLPHFDLPTADDEPEVGRPIHYFQTYFSSDLLDHIVEQSNLYSVQKDPNKPLQITRSELEIFISTIVYMSIFGLPRHRMYWMSACRVSKVADVLSRNRWEEIKKNLHLNDNTHLPQNRNDPDRDKLFKIRPIITHLKQKFIAHTKPQMLCIDEQIVPYKGMSALKQYNPKKPNKWGYKIFVLCDNNGITHDFEIYTGKILPVPGKEDIGASGNIVLHLASSIPKHKNHLLFFDNWFTSLNLMTSLYKDGIASLGTVRKDRIKIDFKSDKQMKKEGAHTKNTRPL